MTEQLRDEVGVDAVNRLHAQGIASELSASADNITSTIGTVAQQSVIDVSQIQLTNTGGGVVETPVDPPKTKVPNNRKTGRNFSWQEFALCKGQTDLFFPPFGSESERERDRRERLARRICEECSVTIQCLEFALAKREEAGFWGGTNESDRRRILRRRRMN